MARRTLWPACLTVVVMLLGGCQNGAEEAGATQVQQPKATSTTMKAADDAQLWVFDQGFDVQEKEGRIWVFAKGSKELEEYKTTGDMGKRNQKVSAGPDGKTVVAPDAQTALGYLFAADGFLVVVAGPAEGMAGDNVVWVFQEDSRAARMAKQGALPTEPAMQEKVPSKKGSRTAATVKAPDQSTLDAYLAK